MSISQLESLFQEGAQFNVNELQAGQGSGLGLFISKGMAEQHGGALTATSDGLGLGTTFTLSIPLYYVPEQEVSDQSSPPSSRSELSAKVPEAISSSTSRLEHLLPDEENQAMLFGPETTTFPYTKTQIPASCTSACDVPPVTPLKILVVDDVASNRKLIARMARNRNHTVEEAIDGQDAVEKFKQSTGPNNDGAYYDVILMDYEMPRLNGPDAVREIRRLGCQALIVGVTGNVLAEDVRHFIESGANEVLPKPVKFNKLEQIWMESSLLY